MRTLILTMLCLATAPEATGAANASPGVPTPGALAVTDENADKLEVAAVIETAVERVLVVLKNKELSREAKRKSVTEIIEPLIDFELLAMLSLGRTHWSRIDKAQRAEFTELFVETLKRSYFDKLELFTDEVVEYDAPVTLETKGAPKFYVSTYILSKGDRIKVAYELARRETGWRVYDFEIEGVSVRKSYGSQYNDFLREQSFEKLLETMRRKLKEAEERQEAGSDEK